MVYRHPQPQNPAQKRPQPIPERARLSPDPGPTLQALRDGLPSPQPQNPAQKRPQPIPERCQQGTDRQSVTRGNRPHRATCWRARPSRARQTYRPGMVYRRTRHKTQPQNDPNPSPNGANKELTVSQSPVATARGTDTMPNRWKPRTTAQSYPQAIEASGTELVRMPEPIAAWDKSLWDLSVGD